MSLYFSDDNPNSRFYIGADPLDLRGNNLARAQQILLTFKLPSNQNSERTFILYTEGHYQTIH